MSSTEVLMRASRHPDFKFDDESAADELGPPELMFG
jgi:hypothetical protein